MTKVKFEVGKEYIDNHGENYTVVSRDAEFVTVEPVGFFSNYKCEVAEDANGNEEIKEIKVGRVKSTLKANFGLTEIKARVDMQEKALAKAVEDFETSLNAGLNLNRLVLAAGNIGYCLEEIARMETLIAQGKTGARKFTGADGAIYFTGIDGATYLVKSEKFFLAVENAEGDEIDAIHEFKTIEDALKSFVDSGEKVGDIFDENEIPVCGIGYGRIYTDYKEVRDFYYELKANEINDCIDDYIVDIDAAVEVEEINAETAEIEIPVTVLTVRESEIKAAVSKYNAIGEHFDSIMDVAVDEGLPKWEREQKKLIRKHYAAECKEKAKFLRDFFARIGLPKKVLKVSVKYDYSDILGTVDYTIEISPKTEKIDADQLEKIAEYFESRDTEVEVDGFDFYEFDDVLDEEDAEIEINILSETTPDDTAAIETENVPAAVEEVEAEKNPLKAKVEEILNRPRKPIIDWKATFEDMQVLEILSLQKDLKKFLKLGQIDLAENVFSMLKTLCRNYRAVAA